MGMREYIIRRLLLMIPTLMGTVLLVFAVTTLFTPEMRASLYVSEVKHVFHVDEIIKRYGLDQPFYIQFTNWLTAVFQGNLGWSKLDSKPVLQAIMSRLPATIEIVLLSIPFIVFLGIFLGVQSATHRDKPLDHVTRVMAIIGWSLPSFWIGTILLAVFYGWLGWFPSGRLGTDAYLVVLSKSFNRYTGFYTIDSLLNGQYWIFVDALRHMILPATVLTIIQIALIVRVMRSSMLESLSKGYIVAARARGLTQKEVINKHARRNALIPAITLSGLLIAGMLTGVVITETVFNFKGIGNWAAKSALILDIAPVIGFALLSAVVFVTANLIVDILYAYIDPRIRLE